MSLSLVKGQKISLEKTAGTPLRYVVMGLGWDARRSGGLFGMFSKPQEIDLDASCVLFDGQGKFVDAVWFRQLRSRDGSVGHTGDNRTGAGEGDDEQIRVDLGAVPAEVQTLMFVVNSFTGQDFSQIENATCRLLDAQGNREIARYNLSAGGAHTAMLMVKLYRHGGEWKLAALGEHASGRTFQDLGPAMQAHL